MKKERAYNAGYETLGNIMEICDETINAEEMTIEQFVALMKIIRTAAIYTRQYMYHQWEEADN